MLVYIFIMIVVIVFAIAIYNIIRNRKAGVRPRKMFSLEGDLRTVFKRAVAVGVYFGTLSQITINSIFGTEYFDYPSKSTASGMTFDIIWHHGWPFRQTLNFSKTLDNMGNGAVVKFEVINMVVNILIWVVVSVVIFMILKTIRSGKR